MGKQIYMYNFPKENKRKFIRLCLANLKQKQVFVPVTKVTDSHLYFILAFVPKNYS